MLRTFYADMHVHIGQAGGRPVKISASLHLTIQSILEECAERKGIHLVGIVDAVCTPVLEELEAAVAAGKLYPLGDGGLVDARGKTTLILGAELEAVAGRGAAHYLAYFPTLERVRAFHERIAPYVTNMNLSSQRVRLTPAELLRAAREERGLFFLAHAFTPHKGYFGQCADRLADVFGPAERNELTGIELGLSADTSMADRLPELHAYPYMSNSDAHSTGKIAREYNVLALHAPTFGEWEKAMLGRSGCHVVMNCGLDPRLGKYHRTFCRRCAKRVPLSADRTCSVCGSAVVVGVSDRIVEIAERVREAPPHASTEEVKGPKRPPYRHQVPLEFVPGLGPVGMRKLLAHFGSEMAVLHAAGFDELASVVGERTAGRIIAARNGQLRIAHGAGGVYGRVSAENDTAEA